MLLVIVIQKKDPTLLLKRRKSKTYIANIGSNSGGVRFLRLATFEGGLRGKTLFQRRTLSSISLE